MRFFLPMPLLVLACAPMERTAETGGGVDSGTAEGGGSGGSGGEGGGADGGGEGGDTGASDGPCNGHLDLCERRLDELTLAGTHNSMSNADAGWWFPNQTHGIRQQLDDGVRALMLDTHDYWGEPYLCHSYCELGKQPLVEGMGEVADFLAANRREVVLIIFQDAITVDATVGVFEELGLDEVVWAWDPEAGALPTLGELIAADTRLIVSAEVAGPPPAWYHHAWDLVVDTPYSFGSVEDFSCELNRGGADNPLFLVNHWLSTPTSTEEGSAEANTAEVLRARAEQCVAEQGRPVNVLAVDFYDQGELIAVVDELNGVGG